MGVEVDWHNVKTQCPLSESLGTFLGALFQFIKQLGLEHCDHLEEQITLNKLITIPVLSKATWGRLQEMHLKTLSCSYVYQGCGNGLATKFHDIVYVADTASVTQDTVVAITTWGSRYICAM
jgi:hypothetical protein